MSTRKIEAGCYAVIRATGEPVQVLREFPNPYGGPRLFAASDGGDYQASELKRLDAAQFAAAEEMAEERMFRECGF